MGKKHPWIWEYFGDRDSKSTYETNSFLQNFSQRTMLIMSYIFHQVMTHKI